MAKEGIFIGLFIYFNADTRFEFHSEFVFVDCDFFNQPPDKLLVIFSNRVA
jgi:hypothetical protein